MISYRSLLLSTIVLNDTVNAVMKLAKTVRLNKLLKICSTEDNVTGFHLLPQLQQLKWLTSELVLTNQY